MLVDVTSILLLHVWSTAKPLFLSVLLLCDAFQLYRSVFFVRRLISVLVLITASASFGGNFSQIRMIGLNVSITVQLEQFPLF